MVNKSSLGIRPVQGPMGVAVGVGDGVAVDVGIGMVVDSGVWLGSWETIVVASMEGGGMVGTAVAKPVGAKVGGGGRDTAVSRPQPTNKSTPTITPSPIVTDFLIAPNCIKSSLNW
jgi:hypothetical protein